MQIGNGEVEGAIEGELDSVARRRVWQRRGIESAWRACLCFYPLLLLRVLLEQRRGCCAIALRRGIDRCLIGRS